MGISFAFIFSLVVAFKFSKAAPQNSSNGYGPFVTLKPNSYYLRWLTTGNQPKDTITFELTVATLGWVGLGFTKTGGMAGADIVVYEPKTEILQDSYATANGAPKPDSHQDYQLIRSSKNVTHTILEIARKLRTCDSQDLDIGNGTTKIIWAFGDELELAYHKTENRGVANLLLLAPEDVDSKEILKNTTDLTFIMSNATIPPDKTTWYYCKMFQLPEFNETQYMLGYEPVIQVNNAQFVHHMDIYHCTEDVADKIGMEGECYDDPKSPVYGLCTTRWISLWAKGEDRTIYPKDFGFPFPSYSNRYLRLEVHYDNSGKSKTNPDNSGMRLFFAPKPQETNIGGLVVRVITSNESMIIPPRMPKFTLYSFCTADCTKALPSTGIKIISAFFHAHLTGASFKVRHIRNGTELPPIAGDENYDSDYQFRRVLVEPVTILPNDVLLMECSFNTVNGSHKEKRVNATLGGYATTDEMCSSYLEYYPKVEGFSDCFVSLTPETLAEALKTKLIDPGTPLKKPGKAIVGSPNGNRSISIKEYALEYDWTVDPKNILSSYQEITAQGKYHLKCGGVGVETVNGRQIEVSKPDLHPNASAPYPLIEWRDSDTCQNSAMKYSSLSLFFTALLAIALLFLH